MSGRRADRIFHRRRRLPQYPDGAGYRQGSHREQHRFIYPPWLARNREHPVPCHQHRSQWSDRDDGAGGRVQAP